MKSKKSFTAPKPLAVTTVPTELFGADSDALQIHLLENPSGTRYLNFSPWLGKGIDAWVHACAGQFQVFVHSKSVEAHTVVSYWSGICSFFKCLVATRSAPEPAFLLPRDIHRFLAWLSEQGLSYSSQKTIYSKTKSVLTALVRRRLIPAQDNLFPGNPFPGSNSRSQGQAPLSTAERQRLATALRDDLIAIHRKQFCGTDSAAIVVYVLALAIRCGANLSPLLEATRDCLHDHPFMPTMKRLKLFKRRGNATKITQLRYCKNTDDSVAVTMDGVALVQKVLIYSEPLLVEAKTEHLDRLWLYRINAQSPIDAGKVSCLTRATLTHGIAALIDRHHLLGDDGGTLRLNLSRLRKTVEMRFFDLSGGDLIATAALMGHDPKVADTHYLACTQKMRENATFVGEVLPDIYRNGGVEGKFIPILPNKTPAGRCKDPYEGDKSPKNGAPCDDFFACFSCTSYAITGSQDDLHRLFSFYFFLGREMHNAKTEDWRSEFRQTMLLIDRFTSDKFDAEVVAAARKHAHAFPIAFWAAYTLDEGNND